MLGLVGRDLSRPPIQDMMLRSSCCENGGWGRPGWRLRRAPDFAAFGSAGTVDILADMAFVMESLQGHFLVASPHLRDPNFVGTVVLMVRHDQNGALGLVINRPADKTLCELWKSVSDTPCHSDRPIHLGGPVPGPLMAVHTHQSLADAEISPGIYFVAERDKLESLVARVDDPFRVFVGHSGWGSGQLESELDQGAWLTMPATRENVFGDPDDLWQTITKQIGAKMLQSMLKIKDVPNDPSMN